MSYLRNINAVAYDYILSKVIKHQNGRPAKQVQLNMRKKLHWFFERGSTATLAAQRTGININTVCKYFEEFFEQVMEAEKSDFLERQKKERERTIIAIDGQIFDAYEFLNELDMQIAKSKQEGKMIPRHLLSLKLETGRFISVLTERKGLFLMQPSVDEAINKKIETWMRDNAKTG